MRRIVAFALFLSLILHIKYNTAAAVFNTNHDDDDDDDDGNEGEYHVGMREE